MCNVEDRKLGAPDLVLDLLLANERPLSARALCRAAKVMQISEVAMRVALTRLSSQEKIFQPERGRYAINLAARPLLRDVDDWRNKEKQLVRWNGAWIAVHDGAVQRSDKTAWRQHSLALALRGFAGFQPGLHLRPDNLAGGIATLRIQLSGLGLAPQALVFRITDLDKTQLARARTLWEADKLARRYDALVERLGARTEMLRQEAQAQLLRESLLLGREAIGHLIRDPLLPAEIMPPRARHALLKAATDYQDQGRRMWRNWLEDDQER